MTTGAEILLLLFWVAHPASIVSVQASDRILDYFNYGDTLTSGRIVLIAGTTKVAFVTNLSEQQNVTVTTSFSVTKL